MDDPYSLHRWYDELRPTLADREIVDAIKRRMADSGEASRRFLALILASELRRQQRYRDAEAVLIDVSKQDPNEPYPLISLAEQKLYYEADPATALALIELALESARASGRYHRCALGVKARIAGKLRRYGLIEDALREIMTVAFTGRLDDVGVERDFVDRLPIGAIDASLREQYDAFCRNRASKTLS